MKKQPWNDLIKKSLSGDLDALNEIIRGLKRTRRQIRNYFFLRVLWILSGKQNPSISYNPVPYIQLLAMFRPFHN